MIWPRMNNSGRCYTASGIDIFPTLLVSVQIGLTFLHLAVDSQSSQVRRAVIKELKANAGKQPQVVNSILSESLTRSLIQDKPATSKTSNLGEEHGVSAHRQARLLTFLSSTAAIGEDIDLTIRENLMAELIVLGHHPAICRPLFTPFPRRGPHFSPG
jgi:hypothetical protein